MTTETVLPPQYITLEPEELPSYSAGIEVYPTGLELGHFEIKVDISNPRDVYDINDIICGTIKFSPPKSVTISSVFAIIEGKEHTRHNTWMYSKYATKHIKLASYILPAIPDNLEAIPGNVYTFPFMLQVPELLPADHCKSNDIKHLRIPPSIDSRSGMELSEVNLQQKTSNISYRLGVCVKIKPSNNLPINNKYQAFKPILISPSYSLTTKDIELVSKHLHTALKTVKTSLLKKSEKSSISLSLGRIEALSILSNHDQPQVMPLHIALGAVRKKQISSAFQIQRVNVSLLAHTNHTQKDSDTSQQDPTKLLSQKFAMPPLLSPQVNWQPCSSCGSSNSAYTASLEIPIILPVKSRQIVPSFESCLMSRSYSIVVTVFFRNHRASIEVPVNIVRSTLNYSIAPYSETAGLIPLAAPSEWNYSSAGMHPESEVKRDAPADHVVSTLNESNDVML